MYMSNPEDYLETTGHLIKPSTPKSKSIETKTKEHDMTVQDKKLDFELEDKNGVVAVLNYIQRVVYFLLNYLLVYLLLLFVVIN